VDRSVPPGDPVRKETSIASVKARRDVSRLEGFSDAYSYFRRYEPEDGWVVVLNLVLLFVVLVYVYPLKFLYAAVFNPGEIQMRAAQGPQLFVVYGVGFAAVFTLLALLHLNAYRSRVTLGLSPLQVYEARASIALYASTTAVGVISALVALVFPELTSLAGFAYFLIAAPSAVAGTLVGRRRRREAASGSPGPGSAS
jgi:hypothetical protein